MENTIIAPSYGETSEKINDILKEYELDFTILKLPLTSELQTADGNGILILESGHFGLFRHDTHECLNTVKEGYRVSQTSEVMQLVMAGLETFDNLKIVKAGALQNGKKVFIQLEIDTEAIVGRDQVTRYVTIVDSNDGSSGLSVGIGDFTLSCSNQFFRFYREGITRMRHSESMDERILEIPKLIKLAMTESDNMIDAYRQFVNISVTDLQVDKLAKLLVGATRKEMTKLKNPTSQQAKKINNVEGLYNHLEDQMKDKGKNLWGLFSGVTSWTTHKKQAPKRADGSGRIETIMVGDSYKTNQKALKYCFQVAKLKL